MDKRTVKRLFLFVGLILCMALPTWGQTYTFKCVTDPATKDILPDSCEGCAVWEIDSRSFNGLLIYEDALPWRWIEAPYTLKVRGDTIDIWEHTSPPSRLGRNMFFPDRESITLGQTPFMTMPEFLDSAWCPFGAGISSVDTSRLFYASDSINLSPIYRGDTLLIVGRHDANVTFDSIGKKYIIDVVSGSGSPGVDTLNDLIGNIDIVGGGINIVTQFGQTITVTGTEIDGSTTNEIQRLDTFAIVSNQLRASLLNDAVPFSFVDLSPYLGTGTVMSVAATAPAAGFTITGSPITTSGTFVFTLADDLAALEAMSGTGLVTRTAANTYAQRALLNGAGISVTNGSGVGGNPTITNTSPDQTVSITGGGINVVTGTYPNFTITGTEIDGSISNELQTLANTSNATSHTATLSNSGGSLQLVEGTGITLTTTGSGLDGIVTLASSVTQYTDENAQDAVGTILTDSPRIDFTYNDAANTITADLVFASVADAFLQNRGALTVMGRAVNSTGQPNDIASTADGQVLRRNGTTLDWGTVKTIGITDQAVTYVKLQNAVSNNVLLGNNNGAGTSYEEINPAAAQIMLGYLDGAGANQRIAYFTDANTLAAEAAFLYDAGNDRMTITSTTPAFGAGGAILNLTNTGPDGTGSFLDMRGDITGNMLAGMVNSNTGAGANTLFNIAQNGNGAGDAFIQTQISGAGGSTTSFGIDNSDGNKFKISPTGNVPGENANASFVATNDATPRYGFNIDAPSYEVDIAKQARSKQWINVLAKPTVGALGTGLGTAPTINDISGSNNGFSITFTTGTAPVANGELFQVTYNTTFPAFAIPVFSQGSARTADDFLKFYSNNLDGAGFKMTANGTLQATKQYVLNFAVTGF